MFEAIIWFSLVVITTGLAAVVATQAWDYAPARMLVAVSTVLLLQRLLAELRAIAPDPDAAYLPAFVTVILLCLLDLLLLLFFAMLFAPTWFTGRLPALWIGLPYGLATLLIVIDQVAGLGLLFDGVRVLEGSYGLRPAQPGGRIMLIVFIFSWLPHFVLLGVAFAREKAHRLAVALLILSLGLSIVAGTVSIVSNLMAAPITLALAYAVLRTRLLAPTRAGLELAVHAMEESVLVIDAKGRVAYTNRAAQGLGLRPGNELAFVLADAGAVECTDLARGRTDERVIRIARREIVLRRTPIADNRGRLIGDLLLGRDITDLEQQSRELIAERARLSELVERLSAEQARGQDLAATVRALSIPVIPALPGVLILPLIGDLDAGRIDDFISVLLHSIERERARLVLIDITGLPLLDTFGAQALINAVQAAGLLGARCVLVGVRPEIAESLVSLGISLEGVGTAANLQQALLREIQVN